MFVGIGIVLVCCGVVELERRPVPVTVEAPCEPEKEMAKGARLSTPDSGRLAPNTRAMREESMAEINERTS